MLSLQKMYSTISSPALRPGPSEKSMPSSSNPVVQIAENQRQPAKSPSFNSSREDPLERTLLVPLPEELPPLKDAHDFRNAVLLFTSMLFLLLLLLGHGIL